MLSLYFSYLFDKKPIKLQRWEIASRERRYYDTRKSYLVTASNIICNFYKHCGCYPDLFLTDLNDKPLFLLPTTGRQN